MTRNDILFYLAIVSALATPATVVAMIYTMRGYYLSVLNSNNRSETTATLATLSKFSKSTIALGVLSIVLFISTLFLIRSIGGVPGPQGLRGEQGPPGPSLSVDPRIDALTKQVVDLQQHLQKAQAVADDVSYIQKMQECLEKMTQQLSDEDVKTAMDHAMEFIANNMQGGGLRSNPLSEFISMQQRIDDIWKTCAGSRGPRIPFAQYVPTEDQMHTPAPGEPSNSDAAYRYRKYYYNFKTTFENAKGLRMFLADEILSTKRDIEKYYSPR